MSTDPEQDRPSRQVSKDPQNIISGPKSPLNDSSTLITSMADRIFICHQVVAGADSPLLAELGRSSQHIMLAELENHEPLRPAVTDLKQTSFV